MRYDFFIWLALLALPAYANDTVHVARALDLINAERTASGCPPLILNEKLTRAARRHSDAMAEQGFFAHTGPDGTTVSKRVSATGYGWVMVAENIAAGYPDPQAVVHGWINSPRHHANIVNCTLSETGLARTYQARDKPLSGQKAPYTYYWVQVFAKPRR